MPTPTPAVPVDTTGDGRLDAVAIDTNGDGVADRVVPIGGAVPTVGTVAMGGAVLMPTVSATVVPPTAGTYPTPCAPPIVVQACVASAGPHGAPVPVVSAVPVAAFPSDAPPAYPGAAPDTLSAYPYPVATGVPVSDVGVELPRI
jgi:hypothetical protein